MDDRRIVILGKTGSGKSSLANTIFGDKRFKIGYVSCSETSKCQAETKSVNGRNITLIDTPGFFDTQRTEEELKLEVVRCITECAPGPHAFLIVLKVEKFTEQEQAVINKIHECFSAKVFKYATVIFTHGDELPEGWKIEEFFLKNRSLNDLVEKCGGRCHIIDNKRWNENPKDEYRSNQFQVEELLKSIDEMVKKNNGCYTNEMLQAVEEEIQQEVKLIRKLSPNMPEKEARQQAKARVLKKLMIKLTGIVTGVLLGALFGVGVMVVAVFKAIKSLPTLIKTAVNSAVIIGSAAGVGTGAAAAAAAGCAAAEGAAAVAGAAAVGGAAAEGAAAVAGAAAVGGAAAEGAAAVAGAAAVGGAVAEGGAASVGGAAVAAGAIGAAEAAGIAVGTVAVAAAVAGGVIGGVAGYHAAEGADTAWDAVKRATGAVKDEAISALDKTQGFFDRLSQPTNYQQLQNN
ncbi:uncharacterized protein ABDE67_020535 [Symphorus nematophorus]